MNKLGFAIKSASQGASDPRVWNEGPWTNKVVDIREYLKLFDGLRGTDNVVTFMSFDEGGCFLTLLRAISGRVGDFLSGWIYIPNTIEVSGDDVMNTYKHVRNILSQSNLNDCSSDIESFVSTEYSKKEYVAPYVSSSGEEFGFRVIDVYYSMKEILDTNRYQPYYSKYKAIFLLDKEGEVKISEEGKFEDLTNKEIYKTCILKAPSPEDIRLLGQGAEVVFQDNQEFKSPVVKRKGDRIELYAIRDGFERVALPPVVIQNEVQVVPIESQTIKWYKKIKPSMFVVCNSKHKKIEKGVRILINGTDVTAQKEALISEEDCRQAIVTVSAPDYETSEQSLCLLNKECEIVLSRKVKSYQATIELANGSSAKMTIESKDLPTNYESPLKGYELEKDDKGYNILKLSSRFVWKQRFLGSVVTLTFAVAILISVCIAINAWSDTHHFKFGLPPWEEDRPVQQDNFEDSTLDAGTQNQGESEQMDSADTSLDAAIKYLDNTSTWSKSEMEKYPDLKGLFDDMNNFNLSKLIDDWHNKLLNSQKFKKVYESANKTYSNGWDPKQGSHNPTYNKPNDEQISLTNYINWLDQDRTPKSSSIKGESHPNVDSNGKNDSGKSGFASGKSGGSSVKQGKGKSDKSTNGGL